MKRKLTQFALAATAAVAFAATIAAPAQADRAFQITDPDLVPCIPYCDDTGYQGSFEIGAATCATEFGIRIEADGSLQTLDVPELDCFNEPPNSNIQSCTVTGDVWDGQARVPDTGPAKIDLDICIVNGIWTSYHEVTVDILGHQTTPTRDWVQNGAATITPAQYCCALQDTYFADYYPADNVRAKLLP